MTKEKFTHAVIGRGIDRTYSAIGFTNPADAGVYCEKLRDYDRHAYVIQIETTYQHDTAAALRRSRSVEMAASHLLSALHMMCGFHKTAMPIPPWAAQFIERALHRAAVAGVVPKGED